MFFVGKEGGRTSLHLDADILIGQTCGDMVDDGLYFGGRNFTSTDQLKKGDDVVVYGNIINFMGNTPEMAQGSEIYSINNQTDSGEQPITGPIGSQEEPIR